MLHNTLISQTQKYIGTKRIRTKIISRAQKDETAFTKQ